jgi:hypothetical protein
MKTKLTFVLSLIFLFLFVGSVYGDELEVFEKKNEIELVDLLNSIETNFLRGEIGFPYYKGLFHP